MDSKSIGVLAALGSAAAWAMGAILFKKLGDQLSSPAMALVKSFISAALLGLALLVIGFDRMSPEAWMWLLLSGALGIALGDTFFFAALKELSPHTLIILLTSGQILTVLLAIIFLGEAHTVEKTWIGIVLVAAGIFIVLRANLSGERKASHFKGIALGALSVICMSISTIMIKQPIGNISAMQATFVRMLAGGATMLLISAFNWRGGKWWVPFQNPVLLGQFVLSVCVITFGAFWLSLLAIKHLDVSIASTLNSAEPIFVLPLGYFFLKEKVTLTALAGSVVAVAGIAFLCVS